MSSTVLVPTGCLVYDVVSSLHPCSVLVLCGKESFARGRTERRRATP